MSDIAIKAEGLSKLYRIGTGRRRHDTLRDHIMQVVGSLVSRRRDGSGSGPHLSTGSSPQDFWALKDVSFEVRQGDVVGIVGRNGAGKSTLLKILSRITEPTHGRVEMFGRVGALLEVGTGFHGELTGRENIYLSGAILGMKKGEIDRKFDEIVAFAEMEKFIDTPVKRYSSGMAVRLGFAVAAHLEPEILIVDEVLAVGDAAFRLKCMDKMERIRKEGRTILLVSHNAEAIARICGRAFHVEAGKIVASGAPQEVLPNYLTTIRHTRAEREWHECAAAPGSTVVRLRCARIRSSTGQTVEIHDIRRPLAVEMEYEVLKPGCFLVPVFRFCNDEGLVIFTVQDVRSRWRKTPRPVGRYTSTAWVPGNFLAEGHLNIDLAMMSHIPSTTLHFDERSALGVQIIDSHDGDSARGDFKGPIPGLVRPVVEWTTELNTDDKRTAQAYQ